MRAVIVSGGAFPSPSLLKGEMEKDCVILCADSGGECLYNYGITPHYLIGDFDSINEKTLEFFIKNEKCKVERYPKDKDFTDTELALNKALSLGVSEVVFLGCTGSRLDHVIGNLGLLKICSKRGIKAVIKDEHNEIFLTDKSIHLEGNCGKQFSVQSFGTVIDNLSIIGGKFDLLNYNLALGDPLTISNEFIGKPVYIEFNGGLLLIMYCKD